MSTTHQHCEDCRTLLIEQPDKYKECACIVLDWSCEECFPLFQEDGWWFAYDFNDGEDNYMYHLDENQNIDPKIAN